MEGEMVSPEAFVVVIFSSQSLNVLSQPWLSGWCGVGIRMLSNHIKVLLTGTHYSQCSWRFAIDFNHGGLLRVFSGVNEELSGDRSRRG